MDARLKTEQAFHDLQAARRRGSWAANPPSLRFPPEAYLDHEPWIRPALQRLGALEGKRILDFGCGHGMASVILALAGAQVTAFDLSAGYLHEARLRAQANDVNVHVVLADGARLPFADKSFDAIWGVAILHHLALNQAAPEIKRVLRPGGSAVFCEPWGGNPLLRAARRWLPYHGKERTPDERPLAAADIACLRRFFSACDVGYCQFLGMIRRAWRRCPWIETFDCWDSSLLRRWPSLGRWCRYVVLTLRP
jgi:SAM-dependent methyltransferase